MVLAFAALAAAVLTLPITWPLRYETAIYAARGVVAGIARDKLPYFAFSDTDPIYSLWLWSGRLVLSARLVAEMQGFSELHRPFYWSKHRNCSH